MRFADLMPQMDRFIEAEQARDAARREDPHTLERERMQAAAWRRYVFGQDEHGRAGWQITFDGYTCRETMRRAPSLPIDQAVGSDLRMYPDNSNWVPSLTPANLELAASIARHVVAWVKGEIDELAPSGPWPPPGPLPMVLTIDGFPYRVPARGVVHVEGGKVTINELTELTIGPPPPVMWRVDVVQKDGHQPTPATFFWWPAAEQYIARQREEPGQSVTVVPLYEHPPAPADPAPPDTGVRGVLPVYFDDGSSMIADSISGGADSTDGAPNKLLLRLARPGQPDRLVRYLRAPAGVVEIVGGDGELGLIVETP